MLWLLLLISFNSRFCDFHLKVCLLIIIFLLCMCLLITSAFLEFRNKCGRSEPQLIRSFKLVLLSSSPGFWRQLFFFLFSSRVIVKKRLSWKHVSHIMNQQCHVFLSEAFALIKNHSFGPPGHMINVSLLAVIPFSAASKKLTTPSINDEETFRFGAIERLSAKHSILTTNAWSWKNTMDKNWRRDTQNVTIFMFSIQKGVKWTHLHILSFNIKSIRETFLECG